MVASPRIERRRAQRQQHILQVAARAFAARGLDGARLEDIADQADVARGTLYAHFATKDALLSAVVKSAVDEAAVDVARIQKEASPRKAVRALVRLQLRLWREHPDAMRVGHQLGSRPTEEVAGIHDAFMRGILKVFSRADRAGILRTSDPALAARLLARLSVPLLDTLADHPDADRIYLDTMEGMLLRRARPPRA